MGNSFIGFPVPRAKIADMIIGEAAPKEHHLDHEHGGDDEVNCTNLVGAGGISLPLDDLYFHTFFESLDYFSKQTSGAGAIAGATDHVEVYVLGTANDKAEIYKKLYYKYVPLTWGKDREFRIEVSLYAGSSSTQKLEIGTGNIWNSYGFGFKVQNGLFKAYSRGAGGIYEETIEDWGSSGYNQQHKLRAKLTAGSKVEFYVNEVLVKTDTTCYPTGSTNANKVFQVTANNPVSGHVAVISFSEFQVRQEA